MFQGTFIFPNPPYYGWYLSAGAIFLNTSWSMHNVIAWLKNKPFLSRRVSIFYITTVILVQPYWILEIVANFLYFNKSNPLFQYTRPYEALFRDPWWIFTCCNLLYNIITRYEFSLLELCRVSPRFAILLLAMCFSICFIIVDILSVTHVIMGSGNPDGINPWWKLAFVFKCLTDTVILDDFKTALDRLKKYRAKRMASVDMDALDGTMLGGSAAMGTTLYVHRSNSGSYGGGGLALARQRSEIGSRGNGAVLSRLNSSRESNTLQRVKTRDWAEMEIEYLDLEMQEPERVKTRSLH